MLLALKLLLAPALVVGASLATRRWGAAIGGLLVTLPVVAGPILLIIALDHGEAFGAHAARAALLGLVALGTFATAFGFAAPHATWWQALGAGWLAYFAVALSLYRWDAPPLLGLALACAAFTAARTLLPHSGPAGGRRPLPPSWDLPARALATAVLVYSITTASDGLGPGLSGVLTPFPIAASVLTGFTLAQAGATASVEMARSILLGLYSFAIFMFGVAVLIEPLGTAAAFGLALAAALLVQLGVRRLL